MNDLFKLTSEMVSNINNTSNFTNTQNSTSKSPAQTQEDKLEQIHQQFLKAQEWGNNLTKENSTTEITTSSNQPKKRNKRQTLSHCYNGMGCIANQPKSREELAIQETNFIASLDPRVSFLGSDGQERGVLWLDTAAKRIKFYVRNHHDGKDYSFDTYKNIIIKDKNNDVVRIITFNPSDFMTGVLRAHNLINRHDGLGYEDGYTIEITSSQANTTKFKKNLNNGWRWNSSNGQHTEKFTIIGNRMWEINVFEEKFLRPLTTWRWAYDKQESWKKNDPDTIRWQIHHLITACGTVKNSLDIQELKDELSLLKERVKNLENALEQLKNGGIDSLGACSSTATAIKNASGALKVGFSFIPALNPVISSALDLTNSACSLAKSYGRKRRDVSTVENKFNDNFIKSINQEQHLPSISNHTNDVSKNITIPL